jgi:hypothetical protein
MPPAKKPTQRQLEIEHAALLAYWRADQAYRKTSVGSDGKSVYRELGAAYHAAAGVVVATVNPKRL